MRAEAALRAAGSCQQAFPTESAPPRTIKPDTFIDSPSLCDSFLPRTPAVGGGYRGSHFTDVHTEQPGPRNAIQNQASQALDLDIGMLTQ